jgi:hypothetical protein
MPQNSGVKGKAVAIYCEPLTTKDMGYSRLSPWGKQHGEKIPYRLAVVGYIECCGSLTKRIIGLCDDWPVFFSPVHR